MANELRLYQNFVGGRLDADITNVATAITSPGFAALAEVTSASHMLVTLDPDGLAGIPEIVMVTTHGSTSQSVTATRAQEGTTARAHKAGTVWSHGPVASDMARLVFRETVVDDAAADFSTSSATFIPVDSTKFAYHTHLLRVGEVVLCEFDCTYNTTDGNMGAFDFEVDQPVSANVRTRPNSDYGACAGRGQSTADYIPVHVSARFVATEAGVHGFRPVYRVQSGGTINVQNNSFVDVALVFCTTILGKES